MNIRNQRKLLEKYNERLTKLDELITSIENRITKTDNSLESLENDINEYTDKKKILYDSMEQFDDISALNDAIIGYRDKLLDGLSDLDATVRDTKKKILVEESEELEKMLSGIPNALKERFDRTVSEMKKMHDDLEELKPKETEKEEEPKEECVGCDELGNNSFIQLHVIGCDEEDINDWKSSEISKSRMIKDCVAEPNLYINGEKQPIKFNLLRDDGLIDEDNCDMIASYDIEDKSFFDGNDYMMTMWIGKVDSNGMNEFNMETCADIPKHNEKVLDDITLLSYVGSEISGEEK